MITRESSTRERRIHFSFGRLEEAARDLIDHSSECKCKFCRALRALGREIAQSQAGDLA